MRVFSRVVLPLLIALPLWALEAVSITPESGPTTGGTEVTIKGQFEDMQYGVIFGSVSVGARFVDENTLVAVTPPHLPGVVDISIFEFDIGVGTDLTFEFIGVPPAEYERLLFPVLTPPVRGSFGSEFHTALTLAVHQGWYATITGLDRSCDEFCPSPPPNQIEVRMDHPPIPPQGILYNGNPGRFAYVLQEELGRLTMNLRVHDVTRADLNFGTEIPIVRKSEFANNRIVFLGVPADPRFRNTLRIYGEYPFTALVSINDQPPVSVRVDGGTNIFDPTYGVFSAFPVSDEPMRVTIDADPDFESLLPIDVPLWAMITVTNNDTQVISTITPQP